MQGNQFKPEEDAQDTAEIEGESSDFTSDEEDQDKTLLTEQDEGEEKETKYFSHQYIVDFIADEKDQNEELVLHWALGKKTAGEWSRPDDVNLPKHTTRWSDNLACQSTFEKNMVYPNYRTLQFVFKWVDKVEPDKAIQAINFVILERKANKWHNNGG